MTHKIPFIPSFCRICLSLALIAITCLCACSKPTPAEILSHADEAIARGEANDAVESCLSLDNESLTPSQHCHCALIYAKAAQMEGKPEHMALAASSLKQACQQSVDSVMTYISNLQFSDMAIIKEVYGLCSVDNSNLPIEDYEENEDDESPDENE